MSVTNLGFYHLAIQLEPKADWWKYLLYYVVTLLCVSLLAVIQQFIVMALDAVGRGPILKDLVREEFAGDEANSAIIRRFSPWVFWGFLLVPGLILASPLNDILQLIMMLIWVVYVSLSITNVLLAHGFYDKFLRKYVNDHLSRNS